jgi:ATP-binding cassette subfamily B protein
MTVLIRDAFAKVQRFSADWHANAFAGATVRRITRGVWAFDSFTDVLSFGLLPALLVVIGVTATFASRWPLLALVLLAGISFYLFVSIALAVRWSGPASQAAQEYDSRISATIADAVTGNAVVKAFAAEAREDARFAGVVAKWRALTLRAWNRNWGTGVIQSAILIALQGTIIAIGLLLWSRGEASTGDVSRLVATQFLLSGYLRDVGQHVRNIQRAINEMEDLVTIAKMELEVRDALEAKDLVVRRGRIVFEDVTFGYAGGAAPLYNRFSLEIKAGERVGLVGPSGAGKSTFVKLLQRLYDVDGGRILIDGQDIAGVTQASLRAAIGIVAQEPILFHRTLAENIAYGRPEAGQTSLQEAARLAHADMFIERLPHTYATLVGERGVKLSGGERQRVAIARAILSAAPILVLDEATSSLDSVSERLIRDAIERLTAGRTTIVVAHRLSTVQRLDRILVFDGGRIVEDGAHAELIKRPNGLYRHLFETQGADMVIDAAA